MKSQGANRRSFIGSALAAGAGLLAGPRLEGPLGASGAQQEPFMRRADRYEDSFIFEREPFTWPGGMTLAVWFIPNIEVWHFDSPAGAAISPNTSGRVPDIINYAWREYGIRVGLWRIADVFDAAGIRATVALNSQVCVEFPKAVEEMNARGWEFMGHGITNSSNLANLPLDEEREVIRTTLRTIEEATGKRPRGWLRPGLVETFNTPDLLAEEGVVYVGDWNTDDQPIPMKVKTGKLFSVPYGMEINDMSLLLRHNYTGEQYLQALTDQFDTLYVDSQTTARVMGIPLHPFLTGQPRRTPYLQRAIEHFQQHDRVWFPTGSEIVDAYQEIIG